MSYEFKVSDLAEEFGVHRNTIRNWINTGILPAQEGPGRKYSTRIQHYHALCERFGRKPKEQLANPTPLLQKSDSAAEVEPLCISKETPKLALDVTGLQLCLACGSCAASCLISGLDNLTPALVVRMVLMGQIDELIQSDWPWKCTLCMRCEEFCPMNIPLVGLVRSIRGLRDRGHLPGQIERTVQTCLRRGNNLGIAQSDFLDFCDDLAADMAGGKESNRVAPVDRYAAKILTTIDSRFLLMEPDGIRWWWKIFAASGESWTVASNCWEGVNWAYCSGDDEAMKMLVGRLVDAMGRLNCADLLLPENGHAFFAVQYALSKWFPEISQDFNCISVFDLIYDYVKSGRLFLKKTFIAEPVVFLDSCNFGRKAKREFGKSYADMGREIAGCCVGNLIDINPTRNASYCCGGGCGPWVHSFASERVLHGRKLAEALADSGVKHVITCCLNCRDQIEKILVPEYQLNLTVHYLWEMVAENIMPSGGQAAVEGTMAQAPRQFHSISDKLIIL